jgi:hypothetical protein
MFSSEDSDYTPTPEPTVGAHVIERDKVFQMLVPIRNQYRTSIRAESLNNLFNEFWISCAGVSWRDFLADGVGAGDAPAPNIPATSN